MANKKVRRSLSLLQPPLGVAEKARMSNEEPVTMRPKEVMLKLLLTAW